MTFPVFFEMGSVSVPAHLVFEILAYFTGFRVYLWMRRKSGDVIGESTRWTVILAAAIGGALGSKVLHHMASPARFAAHWPDPLFVMGGKTIVGGLLGGLIAVELVKKFYKIERSTGDLFAIPLCVAIAIGRIGCFLTGAADDTVGDFTTLPWAVDFGDGFRHPTPLYEILLLINLALLIRWQKIKGHAEGQLFAIFMLGYLAFRFTCDFAKPYEIIFGLRGIQWACLFGVLHYTRVLLRYGTKSRKVLSHD
ncbi:MAG: phosphatidylglycerol:prolipoprotein diacylglycerol transferase [Planctomycetota bacterium]|jgi:phosphatidylglycerol:prolipoprotein diacylglycerol transferase